MRAADEDRYTEMQSIKCISENKEKFDPCIWFNEKDIDLSMLKDEDLLAIIHECEFDVFKKNGEYNLIDRQGGNLGDIESETFESLIDVCERLEGTYFNDYFGEEK